MRKTLTLATLAALAALPLVASPTGAAASCRGRANTGTALGAVGGALIGNSISRGGGGAIIGGLGGAVVGHEIARGGCTRSHHAYYRHDADRYAYNSHPTSTVYYDQRGNPVAMPAYSPR